MKRNSILVAALWCLVVTAHSLQGQVKNSVYSMFGIGQLADNNIGINRALGGTGIAFQSGRSINYLNPASYIGIPSSSFVLEVGMIGSYGKSRNSVTTQIATDINVSYFSASLYVMRDWVLSVGMVPYSSINYEINSTDEIDGELTSFVKNFTGKGGLSRIYAGNSFKIYKGLDAGFNASYIFGPITQTETALESGSFAGYELINERTARSFYLDYGMQYSIGDNNWVYTFGVIYGAGKKLKTTDDLLIAYNDITDTLEHEQLSEISIPQKLGLGICAKWGKNFRAGVDYEWGNWSTINFSNPKLQVKNSNRFSIGVEYSPAQPKAHENWFNSLTFRTGAHYKNSYLEIDNVRINSFGVNIGVGIPYEKISAINLSIEYGEEGTLRKGLIKNNYWMLYANISFHDLWIMSPIE